MNFQEKQGYLFMPLNQFPDASLVRWIKVTHDATHLFLAPLSLVHKHILNFLTPFDQTDLTNCYDTHLLLSTLVLQAKKPSVNNVHH